MDTLVRRIDVAGMREVLGNFTWTGNGLYNRLVQRFWLQASETVPACTRYIDVGDEALVNELGTWAQGGLEEVSD